MNTRILSPCAVMTAALAAGPITALAQTQSLAFTGGVLLNPKVEFRRLGAHPSAFPLPPASGSAVNRTYDDGYNGVDDDGNANQTTANWGYTSASQVRGDQLVLSSRSADDSLHVEDAGDFIQPSGNLEYRGSLGPVGASDWGILLGVGYQVVGGEASMSRDTDAQIVEDAYSLGALTPADLPAAPYAGSGDPSGPRIGSVPSRTLGLQPGGRHLAGRWEYDGQFIPVSGGLYFETQIAGRLNGIVSAGMLAMFVVSEFEYRETSTLAGLAPRTSQGRDSGTDFIIGGFAQLGIDWALGEKISLVGSARWQPTESFHYGTDGRRVDIDFTSAFAVHGGFSVRF